MCIYVNYFILVNKKNENFCIILWIFFVKINVTLEQNAVNGMTNNANLKYYNLYVLKEFCLLKRIG